MPYFPLWANRQPLLLFTVGGPMIGIHMVPHCCRPKKEDGFFVGAAVEVWSKTWVLGLQTDTHSAT